MVQWEGGEHTDATGERATAGEIAQALRLLEARRQAKDKRTAETLSIEEAIEQLGLDATPKELAAAVREVRDPESEYQYARGRRLFVTGLAIMAVSFGVFLHFDSARTAPVEAAPPVVAAQPAGSGYIPISALPVGRAALCDLDGLTQLANGILPAPLLVDLRPTPPGESIYDRAMWTITRHADGLYVHVYATAPDGLALANGRAGVVYSTPLGAPDTSAIDLPLSRLRAAGAASEESTDSGHYVTALNVRATATSQSAPSTPLR